MNLSIALECPDCGTKTNRRVSHLAHMARDPLMVCDGCGLAIQIEWNGKALVDLNRHLSKALVRVQDAVDGPEE